MFVSKDYKQVSFPVKWILPYSGEHFSFLCYSAMDALSCQQLSPVHALEMYVLAVIVD